MFRLCARNYHVIQLYPFNASYGYIDREPTVWGFMTSKYSCTHDIGLGGYSVFGIARVGVLGLGAVPGVMNPLLEPPRDRAEDPPSNLELGPKLAQNTNMHG